MYITANYRRGAMFGDDFLERVSDNPEIALHAIAKEYFESLELQESASWDDVYELHLEALAFRCAQPQPPPPSPIRLRDADNFEEWMGITGSRTPITARRPVRPTTGPVQGKRPCRIFRCPTAPG